ncbi:hypothetical protein P3L10_033168 [Capsicum annuum]
MSMSIVLYLITDLDLGSLKADPGERRPISDYDPQIRDEVRKYYIEKEPCQPILEPYLSSEIGGRMCQFASSWFKGSHSIWLEYSVEKDAAYCLCCYLFKNKFVHETTGDFYASKGFRGWNKTLKKFRLHVDKLTWHPQSPDPGSASRSYSCRGVHPNPLRRKLCYIL